MYTSTIRSLNTWFQKERISRNIWHILIHLDTTWYRSADSPCSLIHKWGVNAGVSMAETNLVSLSTCVSLFALHIWGVWWFSTKYSLTTYNMGHIQHPGRTTKQILWLQKLLNTLKSCLFLASSSPPMSFPILIYINCKSKWFTPKHFWTLQKS